MTIVIKSHLSDFNVRVTFSLLSDSSKIKSLRELLTKYKNQQAVSQGLLQTSNHQPVAVSLLTSTKIASRDLGTLSNVMEMTNLCSRVCLLPV